MATFNPYLNFQGNAREAFDFYKSVFGGEFATIMHFGDVPGASEQDEAVKNKIMHIALPLNQKGYVLMGSDAFGVMAENFTAGSNYYISVSAETEDEAPLPA